MPRKLLDWKLKSESWRLGQRTYLVGVVNVAPDAPETGGRFADVERAVARALELANEGADFLEIGAVSWHADAKPVEEAEELRRLIPVLKRLKGRVALPVIAETWRAGVGEKAAEHGAVALRDPSGLVLDLNLAKVAAQHDLGLVLSHMRGKPETWGKLPGLADPMGLVIAELDAAIGRAKSSGVERSRLVVDPGFGMGKRKEQNTEILRTLGKLVDAGLPVMVGPGGRVFAGAMVLDAGLGSSVAAAALAIRAGVHLLRLEEMVEHRRAAVLVDELLAEAVVAKAAPGPKPKPEVVNRPMFADRQTKGPLRPPRAPRGFRG
jgi:dihydropteroate synthase